MFVYLGQKQKKPSGGLIIIIWGPDYKVNN